MPNVKQTQTQNRTTVQRVQSIVKLNVRAINATKLFTKRNQEIYLDKAQTIVYNIGTTKQRRIPIMSKSILALNLFTFASDEFLAIKAGDPRGDKWYVLTRKAFKLLEKYMNEEV